VCWSLFGNSGGNSPTVLHERRYSTSQKQSKFQENMA